MNTTPTPARGSRPLAPRVLATLVLCAMPGLIADSIGRGAWTASQAPFPFVWRDVAFVHLACAFPLAWLACQWICRNGASTVAVLFSAALLAVSFVPSVDAVGVELSDALPAHMISGIALRAATTLAFALSAAIAGLALLGPRAEASPSRRSLAIALVGLIALLAAPMLYVHARCKHDRSRLADFLEQGRLGEARSLAHALLAFDPQADWQGRPLSKAASLLDQHLRELEALVAFPLPSDAPASACLRRAQQFAILAQTEEALEILHAIDDPTLTPDAANLRGTIHEARGEWLLSLVSYKAARDASTLRPPSPERMNLMIRATTGIAYAQRKAGDYVGAEATYQELLALAPNAETHFLLAQFYEDAQNAKEASHHARRAMWLHPGRYRQQGDQLIRKLTVFQFGCLRAWTDRGR